MQILQGSRVSWRLALTLALTLSCVSLLALVPGFLILRSTMACTPPATPSEVFCRAAKCNRLMGRVLVVLAVVLAVVLVKGGAEFIRNSTAGLTGTAERIVGFVAIFAAQFTLLLTALFFARRRASAAHHAQVKANNLKALELLAASATDEATKKDLLARAADLVAGKPGCCK